ncbi:transcriptional regulator GcvA [Roseivivax sp. GX 12232]|uniref:transcriptional regulator GcvA n=1 Tax=Roseivivax sp. GX 12232 TaxID=2900547 RepID=UPI001E3D5180|nr:transcriptional regulator GcvA [Roseivivax sp. GX 12232]MCE0504449.1 transcriptional regulator GcvA [Roseivivax sp. GX 12232]
MPDRLPPLTALRAFDAAARHLSFAKAAEELNVTPAALSFQIKSLEEHLGRPLFRRLNRAVELTEAGRTLAPGAARGFETLQGAWQETRRLGDARTLTVTAGPAFTAKWLAPRMFDFAQAHPEIEMRFSATLRPLSFDRDEVDVAIRFGQPGKPDPALFEAPLLRDLMTPMMGPALAARFPTPESLLEAPLVFDDSIAFLGDRASWHRWFAAAGIEADPTPVARFDQADHAVDMALTGQGVILGRTGIAAQELRAGQLVAPFATALDPGAIFRFLCRKGAESRPQIAAFRTWIEDEVRKVEAALREFEVHDTRD